MRAAVLIGAIIGLASSATAGEIRERHGEWAITRKTDAFERHVTAWTKMDSVAKDGASLGITCSDEGMYLILSLKGLKAYETGPRTRRATTLIKIDDRQAVTVKGNITIPDTMFLDFDGGAAPIFNNARRIGIRIKDEVANKDRDEFFQVPPMDKQTSAIFQSACRAS